MELITVLQAATSNDVIVVDSEERRELAEIAAVQLKFKGRIEVGGRRRTRGSSDG